MRREAPFTVMWASCWAAVQYMVEKGHSETVWPLIVTVMRRS
ncbi:hypothetical protein SALBM217S_02637 [Streptomyces griseoloalbus]